MKRNKEQLISQLKAQGLHFSSFSLDHQGQYAAADAEWNYKDVPHLHYVHELVEAVISYVGDHEIASINIQSVLGLKLPLGVFNYSFDGRTQIYYTTFLFFVLIVETTYDPVNGNNTHVVTTYSIGSPRILQWVVPVIRWLITKNYKNLMSTDIPMRTRRGQLRSWGYSFIRPSGGYGFEQTMNVSCANVVIPHLPLPSPPVQLKIERGSSLPDEWLFGRDDHLGLRVVRKDDHVLVFVRMCPHEGASLDLHACSKGRVTCPWHGRTFQPVAEFDLQRLDTQIALTEYHEISFAGGTLTINLKDMLTSRSS